MLNRRQLLANMLKAGAGLAVAPVLSRLELPEHADEEILPARRYWQGYDASAPWQLDSSSGFDYSEQKRAAIRYFYAAHYREIEERFASLPGDTQVLRDYFGPGTYTTRGVFFTCDIGRFDWRGASLYASNLAPLSPSPRRGTLGTAAGRGKRAARAGRLRGAG